MKTTRYIIPLFLFSLYTACGKNQKPDGIQEQQNESENSVILTADQYRVAGIKTGMLENRQISGTIKASGTLDVPPQQMVSISLPYGGFLKQTDLLQGMKVRKGQLIATVENPDFIPVQQDYLDVASQLEFAKAEYDRQQTLSGENVNALKTLQQARANYQSLKARLEGLEAQLRLMNINIGSLKEGNITSVINIYAPISGFVTKVNANIGRYSGPTDVLFEIVNTDHLHAELTVFEKDVPRVIAGQKIRFILANETRERMATVYLVGREISPERTVHIHGHLDTEDPNLLPGMYLKAYIETGENLVPALPDDAIVKFRGKSYVFILEAAEREKGDYHFTMVEVETGNSADGYTEIIPSENPGLQGKAIVINGAYDLLSKMKNSGAEK